MNQMQRVILCVGIAMVAAMVAYPPWQIVDSSGAKHNLGYGFLWNPPVEEVKGHANIFGLEINVNLDTRRANSINLVQLLLEVGGAAVVVAGLMAATRGKTAIN